VLIADKADQPLSVFFQFMKLCGTLSMLWYAQLRFCNQTAEVLIALAGFAQQRVARYAGIIINTQLRSIILPLRILKNCQATELRKS
jgi:hypothetical protein